MVDAGISVSVTAVYDRRNTKLPIIADCQGRANVHRALCSVHFLRCLGLFEEMSSSFVGVVFQKIWSLLETETA